MTCLLAHVCNDECARRNRVRTPKTACVGLEVCKFDAMADHPDAVDGRTMCDQPLALMISVRDGGIGASRELDEVRSQKPPGVRRMDGGDEDDRRSRLRAAE